MGWASGKNVHGREVGYAIAAECDDSDCQAEIDRGLAYCCGSLAGVEGEWGCGGYFCGEHLVFVWWNPPHEFPGQLCDRCADHLEETLVPNPETGQPTKEWEGP